MFKATSAVQPTERATVTPPRWRWYHAAIFYVVVQVLTFGLSGLVSFARGNKGKSLREMTFGDVSSIYTPSLSSHRTSMYHIIESGCSFQRTKLHHFDVGLCQAHAGSGLPYRKIEQKPAGQDLTVPRR